MSSESLVENYELVADRILTQSAGYIATFQVRQPALDSRQLSLSYHKTLTGRTMPKIACGLASPANVLFGIYSL